MNQEKRYQLESMKKAEDYLKQHQVKELFNDLCASLCFKKPANVSYSYSLSVL